MTYNTQTHTPTAREGVLITGGLNRGLWSNRVEAYNPYISKICKLPNIPETRAGHTDCGGLVCGGFDSTSNTHRNRNSLVHKSCLKFGPSGFVKATVSLRQKRLYHLCWNVSEGVLLLGGEDSPSTTELVLHDGSASVSKFDLTHPAK